MKSPIDWISLDRAEGPTEECGPWPAPLSTYANASAVLRKWAQSAPDTGGYDKCDFKIRWKNGQIWEGRADIERKHASEGYDLGAHVQEFCEFYLGLRKPNHLTETKYRNFLKQWEKEDPEMKDEMALVLQECDLGKES